MKKTLAIISGWAHGLDAIRPIGDRLTSLFEVRLLTGAQVLQDRAIPETDYIVTGSMGGLLAIELLPARCRKLVLISSTARFCAAEGYPCGTHEKVLKRMIVQLKRNPEAVLEEFFRNVHSPFRESRQAIALRKNALYRMESLVDGLEYLLSSDVRTNVSQIDLPVLLLHGAQDRIIPPEASEWLHAHLADSRLKILGNGGHALPAHHFETVMKHLRDFLEPACG